MTLMIFYNNALRDVQAPSRSLLVQAGRGNNPEQFWLSNGGKGVFLDANQTWSFLNALDKMARRVSRGKLLDRKYYAYEILDADGGCLPAELGILTGHPYVGLNYSRINISPDDFCFFAAICKHEASHLCRGVGIAGKLARNTGPLPPPRRPLWWDYQSPYIDDI